jgi:hypothetical protein
VGLLAGTGGIGPVGEIVLSASWRPRPAWSLGLFGELPFAPSSVRERAGTATARATILGGEARLAFATASSWIRPDVGLGAGATLLRLDGSAATPYVGADTSLWLPAVLAQAGLTLRLTRSLRVRADAALGAVVPGGRIVFAGTQVATWGIPLIGASVGLELDVGHSSRDAER